MRVGQLTRVIQTGRRRFIHRARRAAARLTAKLRIWLQPVWFPIVLVITASMTLYFLSKRYIHLSDMQRGIFVEAVGATMDIVVFGIVIGLFSFVMDRRRDVRRQMELIDDFKKWNSDESRYRIAGAVRRLNRLGVVSIDFSGIELSDFSFRRHDIRNISGSTFYGGSWGTGGSRDKVVLERIDFGDLDCRDVVFSRFNPLSGFPISVYFATFRDCNFASAQLQGAVFRGANMEWSEEPPDEIGHWEDIEDGNKAFLQTYYPPFDGADLKGASFRDVTFRNTDFRGAVNLGACWFEGADGLDACTFDDEDIRLNVLRAARTTDNRGC